MSGRTSDAPVAFDVGHLRTCMKYACELSLIKELRALGANDISIGELRVSFGGLVVHEQAANDGFPEFPTSNEERSPEQEARDDVLRRIAAMQS